MNRLTYKSMLGDYGSAVVYDSCHIELSALRNKLGKYEDLGLTPEEISDLKAYHAFENKCDAVAARRLIELAEADKDGRLLVAPYNSTAHLYTVITKHFDCNNCRHKDKSRIDPSTHITCCSRRNGEHCPQYVYEWIPDGYEVYRDPETKRWVISSPGMRDYEEGFRTLLDKDGKFYASREEALKHIKGDLIGSE